jgi:hypothetical protein
MIKLSFLNGEASISDAIQATTNVMLVSGNDNAVINIFDVDTKILYTIHMELKDDKLTQRMSMYQGGVL